MSERERNIEKKSKECEIYKTIKDPYDGTTLQYHFGAYDPGLRRDDLVNRFFRQPSSLWSSRLQDLQAQVLRYSECRLLPFIILETFSQTWIFLFGIFHLLFTIW